MSIPPSAYALEAHIIAGPNGPLFGLHTYPTPGPPHTLLLYIHPFGEEMNKSRRQVALQVRHFAHAGYAVLQCDLTGCGDSGGDLTDADVAVWLADVHCAYAWLQQRWGQQPCMVWGLRLGATIAAVLSTQLPTPPQHLLLWQPVTDGQAFLNQFLRVKLAADLLNAGPGQPTTVAAIHQQLNQGQTVEIGGYELTPALAHSIAALQLNTVQPPAPVTWIDIVAAPDAAQLPPPRWALVQQWQQRGLDVTAQCISGPPFWATQDITECDELLPLSVQLCRGDASE